MIQHNTDKGNKLHDTFKFEYINAREVGVIVYDRYTMYYDENNNITEVCTDKCSIKLKDEVVLLLNTKFKTTHQINRIYVDNQKLLSSYDFIISTGSINKTTQYIIPFLGKNTKYFSVDLRMLNSYVSEENDYIFIRYRFSKSEDFNNLDRKLRDLEYFREAINDTNYSITYKFIIKNVYRKDVKLILDGKYSQISKLAKREITRFHKEDNYINAVLNKESVLKSFLEDQLKCKIPDNIDLDSKPNKQLEIWTT